MIKIIKPGEPNYLNSNSVDLAFEKMQEFYLTKNRGQKRYDFPFNRQIDEDLKQILHDIFHGKCGYCEIRIENPQKGTIDRYRPNNGVRDKNEYYQDLYWWLTFEWDNLIYCCKDCNQYKANYFPILGKRSLFSNEDLKLEKPLLVNPCIENPDQHFFFHQDGEVSALTQMGEQTIELLRLNRKNLVDKRLNTRIGITNLVEILLNKGKSDISPSAFEYLHNVYTEDPRVEFLAFTRSVLLNEIDSTPALIKLLGFEEEMVTSTPKNIMEFVSSNDNIIQNDFFPIEYIEIKNFKGISDLKIDFKEDPLERKSWLFLLGENGVGKSSILQAIAVGLKSQNDLINKKIIPDLIKKGKRNAEIIIKERNSDNLITTKLIRKDASIIQEGRFNSFVIGYGSLRLSLDDTEMNSKPNMNKISYENLFKPVLPLNDITKWLKQTFKNDPDLFDRVAYSIKQLLPHDFEDNDLTVEKGEILFKNSKKSFAELSDGFKSTIILAVDIMMKLSSAHSDMDKMSGVVLIDELGNQLHPRWQMRIVEQLRSVFKSVNFIVSTHHPLCLRGAGEEEIVLLRSIENEVVSTSNLPDPASLRVDQILASEFFGLSSLVDPKIEAKFNQYYELLALGRKITPEEKNEINRLKDDLRNKQQLGGSLREELMYTVIDKLLAEKVVFNKNPIDRNKLKDEAIERVKEVWGKLNLSDDD